MAYCRSRSFPPYEYVTFSPPCHEEFTRELWDISSNILRATPYPMTWATILGRPVLLESVVFSLKADAEIIIQFKTWKYQQTSNNLLSNRCLGILGWVDRHVLRILFLFELLLLAKTLRTDTRALLRKKEQLALDRCRATDPWLQKSQQTKPKINIHEDSVTFLI